MNKFPINLEDLVPRETEFELSTQPGQKIKLCRWSLRVRSWAVNKYTSQGLKLIFEEQKIDEIAELTWFMLKDDDKKLFPGGLNDFLDNVVTIKDQIAIITALLGAVGIGEPEIKKITAAVGIQKSAATLAAQNQPPTTPPKKSKKTTAKSSTP